MIHQIGAGIGTSLALNVLLVLQACLLANRGIGLDILRIGLQQAVQTACNSCTLLAASARLTSPSLKATRQWVIQRWPLSTQLLAAFSSSGSCGACLL